MNIRLTPNSSLREIQDYVLINSKARTTEGHFIKLVEEVGEVAQALSKGHSTEYIALELADVIRQVCAVANSRGIDLATALVEKYG